MDTIILCIGSLLIIIGIPLYLRYRLTKSKMKHGEIFPADVMKEKYGLTIENYTPQVLDPENVPSYLHDLIPLVTKWGIGDDIIRDDLHKKITEEDKKELIQLLKGRTHEINAWLDSFGSNLMSNEAASFMYMMLGLDEMRIDLRDH